MFRSQDILEEAHWIIVIKCRTRGCTFLSDYQQDLITLGLHG